MKILNRSSMKDVNLETQAIVSRPGPFGNPFVVGIDGDRERVIQRFKSYFNDRMLRDSWYKKKVLQLEGKDLICWCAPLRCHAEVIRDYLARRRASLIGCGKSKKKVKKS